MSWKTEQLQSTQCFLHVHNSGAGDENLFCRNDDYDYFVARMASCLNQMKLSLLLYSLLPDQYHIVIRQTEQYAVSGYIKDICGKFATSMNRSRGRTGQLFQGRFKIEGIGDQVDLLRFSHNMHWNPFIAGITRSVFDWKFSSCREYLGITPRGIVSVELLWDMVGGRENYRKFLLGYDPSCPASIEQYLASHEGDH